MTLKDEFLDLLEKDREFRYAVLGYLGLDEIIKRMDTHQQTIQKILERLEKAEEERAQIRREQTKIWEEVRGLREDFNKMREEQVRFREEQTKIWEEISELREEQVRLREDFNKMLARVERLEEGHIELRKGHSRLEMAFKRLEGSMLVGFDSLRKFAGVTFEEFVRAMLSGSLARMGVLPDGARLERVVLDGEEVNLFYEDPLIVGEVTAHAESSDEVDKLLRKAGVAKEKYGREPMLFLVILTAPQKVAREIRSLAEKHNIDLILGKET